LPVNVDLFRDKFADTKGEDIFNLFNALRALDMLEEVAIPVRLANETVVTTRDFSDGQFQSIYIFAISELFKDRQCLTFLDEPDAFLHPEWQFQFLDQVLQISEQAAKTNHILMTSHSASTIAAKSDARIHAFEHEGGAVKPCKRDKGELINSLSAGLITFSEKEALLSIENTLDNTNGAILFTEGLSDKRILDTAVKKLFPGENLGFEIQGSFDRHFLRNLFSRNEMRDNYSGRKMFALFDFDDAYHDWNGLTQTQMEEEDPFRGLAKQLACTDHYAMLLPVPDCEAIKCQTLNEQNQPWGSTDCHLSIELLFYDPDNPGDNFERKQIAGGGEIIEFRGNKVNFAQNSVCNFAPERFEVLRPLLEFVRNKI
jgi:putative AbiEii toxin of type IV toxin-antitoxin system